MKKTKVTKNKVMLPKNAQKFRRVLLIAIISLIVFAFALTFILKYAI